VGTYSVTPIRSFAAANPVDIGLLELYSYTFTPGNITIEQLPVTVTAQSNTLPMGKNSGCTICLFI
jgi:hypothetical protein